MSRRQRPQEFSGQHSREHALGFGAELPEYRWTQSTHYVDVYLPLPLGVKRARQLRVEIKAQTLRVALASGEVLLQGKLYQALRVDHCTWQIERLRARRFKRAGHEDSDSSSENSEVEERPMCLHLELAKLVVEDVADTEDFDADREGYWRGVMAQGPLNELPEEWPQDYQHTWWLDDRIEK